MLATLLFADSPAAALFAVSLTVLAAIALGSLVTRSLLSVILAGVRVNPQASPH